MFLKLKITCLFLLITVSFYAQKLDYSVDVSLRNTVRQNVWEELKELTPQRQRVILNFAFLNNRIFNSYNSAANIYGYKPENLITATTFLNVIANEILEGKNYSKDQIAQVYAMAQKSVNSDDFSSKKIIQTKSDELIIKAMWLFRLKGLMRNDMARLEKMARPYSMLPTLNDDEETMVEKNDDTIEDKNSSPSNSPSDIFDVRMRTIHSYGLSGPYMANKVYILYKNGDLFKSPVYPLESFNIGDSKRKSPGKWERWEKNNNLIRITYKSRGKTKQTDVKKWYDVRSVAKNYKFDGIFETLDPFGGATVIKSKTLYLDNSGRFAWKTISGGSFTGGSAYAKSKAKGSYDISKHTITFTFENGKKEQYFFALYPDSDRHFIIGRSHFVPRKEH